MDIKKKADKGNLELYLHIPFCIKKCDYCDFLSGPATTEKQRQYLKALQEEIVQAAEKYRERKISTVFFGGGTPSIVEAELLAKIMVLLKLNFTFLENAEITMEVNPGTVTFEKLKKYRESGINRLSIGCQSIHERELKQLGRIHTFEEFKEGFFLARKAGFQNINVDLMSGLPEQTLEMWEQTLRTIAEMEPEHISAYSLIIEEGTPFAVQSLQLPDEDTERKMYYRTKEILQEYGFHAYEISNYAKEGYECRHNVGYWIREDYLGLGIGAASLVDEVRFTNETDMEKYIECRGNLEQIHKNIEKMQRKDQIEETMILGLRLRRGVNLDKFRENFGEDLTDIYAKEIKKYKELGMLEEKEGYIRLTEAGVDVSNWILSDFIS